MKTKTVILVVAFLMLVVQPLSAWEVYFSPRGGCTERIIEGINDANSRIDVAMYSFTSEPISEALVQAHRRGVKIRVLLDKQQAGSKYSQDDSLEAKGIEVIRDIRTGYMHLKVCLIDEAVLFAGSFNWSKNAEERNQEDMLVFTEPDIVAVYQQRFDYLWVFNGGVETSNMLNTWGSLKNFFK